MERCQSFLGSTSETRISLQSIHYRVDFGSCCAYAFYFAGVQPELLYGQLSGVGTSGVIFLLTLVNFSALAWYFTKGRFDGASWTKSLLAPAISSVFFIALVVLVAKNFELLVGGEPGQRTWMLYSLAVVQIVGMGLACYYRVAKPHVFEKLGRCHS